MLRICVSLNWDLGIALEFVTSALSSRDVGIGMVSGHNCERNTPLCIRNESGDNLSAMVTGLFPKSSMVNRFPFSVLSQHLRDEGGVDNNGVDRVE